jgi:hypothetical protein
VFGREGFQQRTDELKALARDYRLRITSEEYKQVFQNVMAEKWEDNSIFDIPESVSYQKTANGMIPFEIDTTPHSAAYYSSQGHSTFDMGCFSQESGINKDEECLREKPIDLPPVRSNNIYNDLCAQFASCLSLTESDPQRRHELVLDLYGVMSKFSGSLRLCRNKTDSLKGQYVSMYQGSDKRKKAKRLRSATEPKRRTVTPVKASLTMESSLI